MDLIVLTIGQAYGRFMMRLKDLKVYEQEKSLSKSMRQIRVLNPMFDSSVLMLCLLWLWPCLIEDFSSKNIKRLALYVEHKINEIDLKLSIQENISSEPMRQLRVLEVKFDSSDFMLCLVSIDYTWLWINSMWLKNIVEHVFE